MMAREMERSHKVCSRCVMDTADPDITFDAEGICRYCHTYEQVSRPRLHAGPEGQAKLNALVSEIKAAGNGKSYDCVIGVSGGVDSTYVAYLVHQLRLRPLAVHLDNGWDSELAVSNIEKTLKKLRIDLYTFVIDWEEFRDLQIAFLKASTPDAEVPTDHAILAVLYRIAAERGIRHILSGANIASEALMPLKWGYGYYDLHYIKTVHRRFGTCKLSTYPHFGLFKLFYYMVVRKIRMVPILNYVHYDKLQAMRTIQDELGWIYYGGKHYESIYTHFFQAYILPRKFNIDKRKAHYSNLIWSGQMSRGEAVEQLDAETYDVEKLKVDREYVIKKLGLKESEFEELMRRPTRTFFDYPNNYALMNRLKSVARRFL